MDDEMRALAIVYGRERTQEEWTLILLEEAGFSPEDASGSSGTVSLQNAINMWLIGPVQDKVEQYLCEVQKQRGIQPEDNTVHASAKHVTFAEAHTIMSPGHAHCVYSVSIHQLYPRRQNLCANGRLRTPLPHTDISNRLAQYLVGDDGL
jgi:hypothetical protein